MINMSNHVNTAYLMVGIVVVIACVLSYIYTDQTFLLINCVIGLFFIIGAFTKSPESVDIKSRDTAQTLSVFPGAGHLYIGVYKRGIVFVSGLIISISIFLSIYFIDVELSMLAVTISLTYVVSLIIWSALDVSIVCDIYGIDDGGPMVFYIRNPKKTEFLLSLIIGIIAVALIIAVGISVNQLLLSIIATIPYFIFASVKYLAFKTHL